MNLKRIETFVLVATLRSFRKAAEQQCTTQPAISSRIANFEAELGVKLFDRDYAAVTLTEKGRELLPYAEQLLMMANQFKHIAGHQVSSTLRLGVSETIASTWLSEYIKILKNKLPRLNLDITVDVTVNLHQELMNKTLDLAFLMGPLSDPDVINHPLCNFPLCWAVSPHLQLPTSPLSLETLSQFPIITYSRNSRPHMEIQHQLKQIQCTNARLFTSGTLSACTKLAIEGLGIATLPRIMTQTLFQSGQLKEITCDWTPSPLSFTAAYLQMSGSYLPQQVTELAVDVASTWIALHQHSSSIESERIE